MSLQAPLEAQAEPQSEGELESKSFSEGEASESSEESSEEEDDDDGYSSWREDGDEDDEEEDGPGTCSVKWCFPLVRSALLELGFAENTRFASADWDFRWGHSHDIEYEELRPTQVVNHFRHCQRELGSKAQCARNLRAAGRDAWRATPRAFALDGDEAWRSFCFDFLCTGAVAIVKTAGSQDPPYPLSRLSTALTVAERYVRWLENPRHRLMRWTPEEWREVLEIDEPPAFFSSPPLPPPADATAAPPPAVPAAAAPPAAPESEEGGGHQEGGEIGPPLESEPETESESESEDEAPPPYSAPAPAVPLKEGEGGQDEEQEEAAESKEEEGQEEEQEEGQGEYAIPGSADEVLEGVLAAVAETLVALRQVHPQLHMDGSQNVWVVKPGNRGRGEGIHLAKTPEEVLRFARSEAGEATNDAAVVQKYIETPLCFEQRKLDIRFWILLTSFHPLEVFYFDAYVRFAHSPFALDRLDDDVAHIINRSVQIKADNFDELNCYWTSGDYRKHLVETTGSARAWDESILPRAMAAIVKVLQAGRGGVQQRDNSFEWLGVDVAVDDSLRPWVLEVNTTPDHSSTLEGDAFDRLNGPAIADLVDLVTDVRRRPASGLQPEPLVPAPESFDVEQRWKLAFAEEG